MAFQSGNSNGFGRRAPFGRTGRRGAQVGVLADMNVVPLVDVVLVLLIIFMLTAHVMEYGMDVQAPAVKTATETTEDLPVVTITRDAKLYLNDAPVNNINLLAKDIHSRFKTNSVFVLGDARLTVQRLMDVLSVLNQEKFDIKVITKPEEINK